MSDCVSNINNTTPWHSVKGFYVSTFVLMIQCETATFPGQNTKRRFLAAALGVLPKGQLHKYYDRGMKERRSP